MVTKITNKTKSKNKDFLIKCTYDMLLGGVGHQEYFLVREKNLHLACERLDRYLEGIGFTNIRDHINLTVGE